MYKLLALDVDDTLTNKAREVPQANLAAIKRAQEAGVFVTIATGRGYLGSTRIWQLLGVEGPVINYGGAMVYDTRTGRPIYETSVQPELVHECLEFARELGVHAQIYQGDGIVYEKASKFADEYTAFLNLPKQIDPDIRKKRWQKVPKVLYLVEHEAAAEVIALTAKRFAGRLKVSESKPGFVEINELSAHKGSALCWVAGHLGILQEEVVSMGDNSLDIEMLQWAGLGVAVGDAQPAAKAAANMLAPNCADGAVAWVIDNIILKK